jgi:hypothetical protein
VQARDLWRIISATGESIDCIQLVTAIHLIGPFQQMAIMVPDSISNKTGSLQRNAMGAIAFSTKTEESWVVAGWAFRQVLDDTASQHLQDSEMVREFEKAKDLGGLMVYMLQPDLAERVTSAIWVVAKGILSGTIRSGIVDQSYADERTVAEYRKGLQQLLEAIPSQGMRADG